MMIAGIPVLEIQNRVCLIQPTLGVAWAPNDRFFAQSGLQFDLAPNGNPVRGLNSSGGLSRIGTLNAQHYAFLNSAAGYWIYAADEGMLTGVALQGELDYIGAFRSREAVQYGPFSVTDSTNSYDFLSITPGAIFEFNSRKLMSLGVSIPVTNNRLYDWALTAQFNCRF